MAKRKMLEVLYNQDENNKINTLQEFITTFKLATSVKIKISNEKVTHNNKINPEYRSFS